LIWNLSGGRRKEKGKRKSLGAFFLFRKRSSAQEQGYAGLRDGKIRAPFWLKQVPCRRGGGKREKKEEAEAQRKIRPRGLIIDCTGDGGSIRSRGESRQCKPGRGCCLHRSATTEPSTISTSTLIRSRGMNKENECQVITPRGGEVVSMGEKPSLRPSSRTQKSRQPMSGVQKRKGLKNSLCQKCVNFLGPRTKKSRRRFQGCEAQEDRTPASSREGQGGGKDSFVRRLDATPTEKEGEDARRVFHVGEIRESSAEGGGKIGKQRSMYDAQKGKSRRWRRAVYERKWLQKKK